MADVTVIGAGVAGLTAAYTLHQRGVGVRLFDPKGPPGPHACSWWAGGMLAPECEGAITEEPVVRHGRTAAAFWSQITNVTHNGTLVVAPERDRADLTRFAQRTENHATLDSASIADLEPELEGRHRRGLFFAQEAHVDPRAALADLWGAVENAGITVETAAAEPANINGRVLDCRGFAAQHELPSLRGVRGEMIVLRSAEITLNRPVRLLHPRHPLYIVPRANGLFMLGATQIESASRAQVTARSALELLSAAYALDPRFAEAEIIEMGTDLRPAFPDNIPRVVKRGNVLHLNGLFRHGFLMSPALAAQAADYLTTGTKGDLFHED
ncbi:FAD-dependent oxidoreductase [Shimia ponticola]|uniref:FAD-dependent oxidoreductase n=1 Tax=Shimia ponticola TaxID=2582893 RepID=UPI0011BE1B10|nr:FAD-dependent oxidoreductase [Shimia ponticola]